jgi:hypothetical protein
MKSEETANQTEPQPMCECGFYPVATSGERCMTCRARIKYQVAALARARSGR